MIAGAKCRVCGQDSRYAFSGNVLGAEVPYFDCPHCGYLQTACPDWLDRAYASPINLMDTGMLWRNQLNVRRVVMTLLAFRRLSGRVVDHAGGYGILVRLLRDAGLDAYWSDKYCDNLLARGFEDTGADADLLTAFEVFEHFVDPTEELRAMLQRAPIVLISTELIQNTDPPDPHWWYLGGEHGQHIGFFRSETLQRLAQRLSCSVSSDGRRLHVFSRTRVPARWGWWQRALHLSPLVARIALRSKMMTDFEQLRRSAAL
jgi:hypothetical protein